MLVGRTQCFGFFFVDGNRFCGRLLVWGASLLGRSVCCGEMFYCGGFGLCVFVS